MAVADDLYQLCVVCDGKGWVDPAGTVKKCEACEQRHVMPVGINARQLERIHRQAELALLVLHAILHGQACWEYFQGCTSGELCFAGLRFSLDCDQRGLPILTDHCKAQLMRHVTHKAAQPHVSGS